jgi:hypothetical protein
MLLRLRKFGFLSSVVVLGAFRAAPAAAAPAPDAPDAPGAAAGEDDDDDAAPAPAAADTDAPKAKSEAQVEVGAAPAPAPAQVVESADLEEKEAPAPLTFGSGGWSASIYGFAELDIMSDSTQSFSESATNNTLARQNTPAGDNPRTQLTARNSRLGFKIQAPQWGEIKTSAVVELDFFGESQLTTKQGESYTAGPARMRHFYAKVETPIVDVLAGQYHDLFAWGGAGFYPNTVAFLALPGEIYHRNPQLRLSKTIKAGAIDFEIAAAAVRPVQRDAVMPDVQGGLKLDINGWTGASVPGASRPVAAPMSLAVSGVARRFSVTDFAQSPANPQTGSGYGIAANAFIPIIPAKTADLSNALSLTGEFTTGAGISDLYTALTGGVGFPALPNPNMFAAAPVYTPNIDPGIVTFDASNQLQAIKWTGVVLNAHYHLPIADGKKVWLSGTYSFLKSSNSVALTPIQGRPFVFDRAQYIDANLWWGVTPAVQVGLSYQRTQQTFGDGAVAHNNRGEGAFYFFF